MTYNYGAVAIPQINMTSRRKLAIIGDEITTTGLAGFKTASATYGADAGGVALNSWWYCALAIMGQPYELVAVSASAGRTTATAYAAFATEVAPFSPQEVWILLGRNDMASAAAATTALASLDSMIAACLAINKTMTIVIGTVIPGDATSHTTAYQQANATYNYGIMRRSQATPNIRVVDIGAAIRNQTSTTGAGLTTMMNADHLNLTVLGHGQAGSYWAADLASALPASMIRPMGNDDDFGVNANSNRMITNPGFAGTGGTLSGGSAGSVPTGWELNSNTSGVVATGAFTTDTGAFPKRWWRATLSGTSTSTNFIVMAPAELTSPSLVTLGSSLVRARYDLKTASLVNVDCIQLWMQIQTAGFAGNANACIASISAPYPATFTLEVPPTVAALTGVYHDVYITINFTTGLAVSGTVSISQPIYEVVV